MRSYVTFALIAALASCKACVTLDRPLSFPCNPDASTPAEECPTAFRCGLEGRCHALDAGEPYLCRSSDDCEGPWRCGLEGRCHPLDAGAPYDCRADTDCEGPWRCGLEKKCHERDAGAAWQCDGDDSRCEARWRCGIQNVCIDSTRDALELPGAGFVTHAVGPLFPNVPSGQAPIAGSVESQFNPTTDAGCMLSLEARSFSWERGGTLTKHIDYPNGVTIVPPGTPPGPVCDDAERIRSLNRVVERTAVLPGPAAALSDETVETLALLTDGQLCRFGLDDTFAETMPLSCRSPFGVTKPNHLKGTATDFTGGGTSPPGYVAWNNTELWWLDSFDGGVAGPFPVPAGTIIDALGVRVGRDPGVIAFTEDELYLARVSGGALQNPDGGTGWGTAPDLARRMSTPERGLHQRSAYIFITSGSTTSVAGTTTSANSVLLDFGGNTSKWYQAFSGHLANCARDANIGLTLAPFEQNGNVGAISRCSPDGGAGIVGKNQALTTDQWSITASAPVDETIDNFSKTSNSPTNAPFFLAATRVGAGNPGGTVWADVLGHLWSVDTSAQIITALVPDRQLSWVGGTSEKLKVGTDTVNWAQGNVLGSGFLSGGAWSVTHDAGFEPGGLSGGSAFVGAVHGLAAADVLRLPPGLFSRDVAVGSLLRIYAAAPGADTIRPPVDIRLLETPKADYFLWRSFDTLWLVTLDAFDGGIVPLDFDFEKYPAPQRRLTPLVNQPITSFAWSTAGDAGHFLDGYVVAGARLFSVTALNDRVWRSDEVVVGLDEPLEVFFDRDRARVALRDGSLFSLPSRVALAPRFAATEGLAQGFANLCGQTLALSDHQLLRLEWAAGQPMGAWQPLNLSATVAATSTQPAATPFAKSRLFTVDRDVLLVHDNGLAYRITFPGACP